MKYRVGDKVKVRKWEDMVDEFGTYELGGIRTHFCFDNRMKQYCGKIVTIKNLTTDAIGDEYYDILEDTENEFCFSDDMFEDDFVCPLIVGVDIYNFIKAFSQKHIDCGNHMTETERAAYEFGKGQILSLLKQVLNEFFKEENSAIPTYIVHVSGLKTATDFASIDEIKEQFGEDKI